MNQPNQPVRIVHIIGSLDRAGTETWLVSILRAFASDQRMHHEVIVKDSPSQQGYAQELRHLDVPVHVVPRNLGWPFVLFRLFRAAPGYDIVHSHRDAFSAFVLVIAWLAGIKRRIAHNHSDTRGGENMISLAYRYMCAAVLRAVATDRIGVSEGARDSLFMFDQESAQVIYCGLDLDPLKFSVVVREEIRSILEISDSTPVLINVGSMRREKNQGFLLEVFAAYRSRWRQNAKMLVVGDGALRSSLLDRATTLGIADDVVFLGVRSDVASLLAAADVFVFPSLFEGLGLAAVEAQASGLPIVMSDTLPKEATILNDRVVTMNLDSSPQQWAAAIEELLQRDIPRDVNLHALDRFSIDRNVEAIEHLYGLRE